MFLLAKGRAREANCEEGIVSAPSPRSTPGTKMFGYSTRNRKFKCLEPQLQNSATRSASKEDTESAVALTTLTGVYQEAHTYLPTNFDFMGMFGARA